MTNYEIIKNLADANDLESLAKRICQAIDFVGCETCPWSDRCGPCRNGVRDWLLDDIRTADGKDHSND